MKNLLVLKEMSVNAILLYCYLLLFVIIGCSAYLVDQSGEVVEAYGDVTTVGTQSATAIAADELHLVESAATDTIIKPYNILETKPLPNCPEGFILANKRCHKRVK